MHLQTSFSREILYMPNLSNVPPIVFDEHLGPKTDTEQPAPSAVIKTKLEITCQEMLHSLRGPLSHPLQMAITTSSI